MIRHSVAETLGGDDAYWTWFDSFTILSTIALAKSVRFAHNRGLFAILVDVFISLLYIDLVDRAFFNRYEFYLNDLIGLLLIIPVLWIKHKWEIVEYVTNLRLK